MSDGEVYIYIYTKTNPNTNVNLQEKELSLETADKKSLVVINGKVSKQAVEDIHPDNIATINVKGDVALEKHGGVGKGDVIEIYTKENKPADDFKTSETKVEIKGTATEGNFDKEQLLIVINGKKRPKKGSIEEALAGISPKDIKGINLSLIHI